MSRSRPYGVFPSPARLPAAAAVAGALTLLSSIAGAGVVMAQIAVAPAKTSKISQLPLVDKDPGLVQPNLMFTLDDSGSMAFNYLPDNDLQDQIFAFHPNEPQGEWVAYYAPYFQGVLATNDTNVLGMRRRASKVNTLYYNPEVRYEPWVDADGKPMSNANPKSIIYHPGFKRLKPGDTGNLATYRRRGDAYINALRLDITGEHAPTADLRVCREGVRSTTSYTPCIEDPAPRGSSHFIKPATYYEFTWPGEKANPPTPPTDADKNDPNNYKRISIADHTEFFRGAERTDCPLHQASGKRRCNQEQEYQNFANWFQYHRTRMHVAIGAVGRAFNSLPEHIRVGYGRINKLEQSDVDGARHEVIEQGVRQFNAENKKKFLTWLNGVVGAGSTPLVNAMDEMGKYYRREDDRGPWAETPGTPSGKAHLSCRRSYHVIMTDGMYNFDKDVGQYQGDYRLESDNVNGATITGPGAQSYQYKPVRRFASSASGTLADYAMDLWKSDLRTDLPNNLPSEPNNPAFWQHVITHTLSFGVGGSLNPNTDLERIERGELSWPSTITPGYPETIDDLWHAAVNSRGEYVDVAEGAGFYSRLQKIMGYITGRIGNTSGVDVALQTLEANNVKFVPSFITRDWIGEVKAFELDEKGEQGGELWRASEKVPLPLARNWFVGLGLPHTAKAEDARSVMFFWDKIDQSMQDEMMKGAGLTDPKKGSPMMAWLRGDKTHEGGDFRRRVVGGVFGHFVNSPPVYIGAEIDRGYRLLPPKFSINGKETDSGGSKYIEYVKSKKASDKRPGMVFVGGNDGVMHAFNAKTGVEEYGFTPRAVISEMARSSRKDYDFRFLVDGPAVERDAYLDDKWQNVLVGTTGAGPRSVFALNVTDTSKLNANTLMWELSPSKHPGIGHVLGAPEVGVMRDGSWVAIFGNGYESDTNLASLFIVDLKTGEVLRELNTNVGTSTDPNGLGGVTLVRDGNQVITAAYAGDIKGNVWKFDLASKNRADWKVGFDRKPLFVTDNRRPVTAPPATVSHPHGGVMVLAGTGKLFENGDAYTNTEEWLYGVWDNDRLVADTAKGFRWEGGAVAEVRNLKLRTPQLRLTDFTTSDGKVEKREFAHISARPTDAQIEWNRDRGWKVPLRNMITGGAAQRLLVKPQLLSGMALFETMSPTTSTSADEDACQTKVVSPAFNLILDPLGGVMPDKPVLDQNGDGKVNMSDAPIMAGWRIEDWTGRSVVLAKSPPEPCTENPCSAKGVKPPICEKGHIQHTSVNVNRDSTTHICVNVDPPSRWWWRELSH